MKTHNTHTHTEHTWDIMWTPRGFAKAFYNVYLDGDDVFAVLVHEFEWPVSMRILVNSIKRKGVGIFGNPWKFAKAFLRLLFNLLKQELL